MPYIGRDLNRGNYLKLDDISSSFNGSTQTFNLTVGGSAFTPGSAFSILVSVGGVIQEPESAYQVNNSEITFANAPTAQDSFFCLALGVPIGIGVPGNGTVNGTQVAKPFNYDGYFYLDDANNRVGIGSLQPTVALDVDGIVKASSFTGGSGGINAGVGTFTGLDVNGNGDISGNLVLGGDLTVNGTTSTIDTNLIGVDRVEVGANSSTIAGIAVTQSGTADLVRLYDGTTQVVTVTDTGDVGIGTDNPFYTTSLDVLDSSSGTDEDLFSVRSKTGAFLVQCSDKDAANPEWRLRTFASENLVFSPGGTGAAGEKVRINSNGRVGINTTDASHLLTVFAQSASSNIARFKAFNGNSNFDIHTDASSHGQAYVRNNIGAAKVQLNSNGASYFTGGNVGIGTDSPDSKLTVAADSAQAIIELKRTNTNAGGAGSYGAINWTAMDGHSVANMYAIGDGDNNGAHLVFNTTSAAANNSPYNAATEERVRIASDGKFGIGDFTSGTVQQALHIKGSDTKIFLEHTGGYDLTISSNTGGGMCGISPSGGYLDLCSNGRDIVQCLFGGNVGIGTDDPNKKLHVHASSGGPALLVTGDIPAVILNPNPANSSDNDRSTFGQATGNNNYVNGAAVGDTVLRGTNSGKLLFGLGTSEKMRINNDGSVNIGLSGESTRLAVKGISGALSVDSRANISLFTGATDGASATGTGILFFNHSGGGQFFGGSLQVIKENSGNGNTDSLMRFATRANGGAVTERMRITSGGTLGINLLSPDTSFRVDCSGAAQFTTSTTNQQNDFLPGQLTVRNNQSAQGAFIDFRADSATGIQGVIAKIGGFNVHSGSGYDGNLFFSTRQNSNNTMVERLRIKNDGIVCLDSATGAIVIGDNSINANYSSARLYIRTGTHTQTSANTDTIHLSLFDRNSQRNGTEGSGSWKSKIQFLAAQINGGAREGAFIQQDIKYNNFSGGSTKMRADLVFATRGDAQSSSSDAAVEQLRITHNGNVLINGSTFYGSGNNALQVHDSTLVLSKVGTGTRNWRFVNNNLVAGNLGLQVSNADNGSTTYVDRIEIDKDGKVCIGNPATDPIANLEVHAANPILYVRDSAGTSVDNDAKIGFGNASHYPVAYLSHEWDGTNGIMTVHTRSGGNENLALKIDSAQKIRTRGATNIGHGGMVYIQGYSDPVADETHSNLTVRGEGGNGFACGTYEGTANYASWIQAGYVPNFTGGSPAAIYPLVLQPNGAPVCIGNKNDAATQDAALLRVQTVTGGSYTYQKWGLSLEHFNSSNVREQKFTFINEHSQGTQSKANSIFRQHAVPYSASTSTYQTFTDRIVYAHRPLYNQYSWYKFNTYAASSGRGGSARIAITWSSRHAGPGGYGEYSIAWTDNHSTTRVDVFCRKQHFLSIGNASHGPYNWTSSPAVTVYSSTGTTSSAGFYLRVEGHVDANSSTYEGGILHHFDIVHNDNNTGANNTYFEFVGNSTPSDADSSLSFN